jgi:hypothetical protein
VDGTSSDLVCNYLYEISPLRCDLVATDSTAVTPSPAYCFALAQRRSSTAWVESNRQHDMGLSCRAAYFDTTALYRLKRVSAHKVVKWLLQCLRWFIFHECRRRHNYCYGLASLRTIQTSLAKSAITIVTRLEIRLRGRQSNYERQRRLQYALIQSLTGNKEIKLLCSSPRSFQLLIPSKAHMSYRLAI